MVEVIREILRKAFAFVYLSKSRIDAKCQELGNFVGSVSGFDFCVVRAKGNRGPVDSGAYSPSSTLSVDPSHCSTSKNQSTKASFFHKYLAPRPSFPDVLIKGGVICGGLCCRSCRSFAGETHNRLAASFCLISCPIDKDDTTFLSGMQILVASRCLKDATICSVQPSRHS